MHLDARLNKFYIYSFTSKIISKIIYNSSENHKWIINLKKSGTVYNYVLYKNCSI